MLEFGWLFWILVAALFFGCGRACGWGGSRKQDRLEGGRHRPRPVSDAERREEIGAKPQARREPRKPVTARAARRESPLKTLQRRFVEGRITLEEYERRLDQLERLD